MKITIANSIAEVTKLGSLWNAISARSPQTVFQKFHWSLLALEVFRDERPYFVAAESGSSVAILPLVVRRDSLAIAGGPLFDYRDAIVAGDDSAFLAAMSVVANLGLPLRIHGVRSRAASGRWSPLAPLPWTAAPFVAAQQTSAEQFANQHARGRRAMLRLLDLGASVTTASPQREFIKKLYRAKANEEASDGENVFQDERCVAFMSTVASLDESRCEIFKLVCKEQGIATLVTFIDGEVRRFYTTWMDPAWSRHSPGIALLFEATRLTLEQGLNCDYMTGEQAYKLRFATGSEPLYKVEASASQLASGRRKSDQVAELKAA